MNYVFLGLSVSALVLGGVVEGAISASPLNENSRLGTNGIGPVRIGMTVAEAGQASGRSFVFQEGSRHDGSCAYVNANGLSGVSFMLIDGKIARIDVENRRIMTLRGAKIGDSEARIKELYPEQIKTTSHPYSSGHYLTFYPKDREDRDYRLIFETSKGKVNAFRGGKIPAVDYIEGCS